MKRRKVAEFLAQAKNEDPRRRNYEQRVRQALLNGTLTEADICGRFGLTPKETRALLAEYRNAGANITQLGKGYTIDRHLAPNSTAEWKVVGGKDGHHRFGFVADTHIGSKHYRDDVLNGLYDWFAREGVTTVYHCGNWIEGEARFNKHELDERAHGMQAQIDLMVELYPQRKGITTYYVTGDDHEGWYCFEPGVEILTEDGWKDLSQVADGDVVAGKDDAGEFVWQPVNKAIRKRHEGHLVRFADRSMDVAVTPDHRFEVWRKSSMHGRPAKCVMTAAEMLAQFKPRCLGIPRATEKWTGHNPGRIKIGRLVQMRYNDHPRIQRPDDLDAADLAILCAWFATEGSTHKNVIGIAQSREVNPDKYVEIRSLIQRLGYRCGESPSGLTFSAPDLAHWLREHCGTYSDNKRLPHWVKDMPEDVLAQVFDALIKGDGHTRDSGWRFYSKSPALRADVTEIAQKLGYGVSEVDHGERYSWMTLSISADRPVAYLFRPPVLELYSGDVFCVSVPTQRIYVRKHGKAFWSMNCQREGVDIGRLVMDTARRAGRRDLVNLGYKEAFITLEHPKTKRHTRMLIDHPGGGSSYAYSYAPQKRVESAQGGEKPGLWAFGHWHKHGYFMARNVHILLVPCTKDLDTFGRKKGLEYHVGGVLVDLWQDEGGAIKRVIPQFELWLDRGYYNQQYNLSGPVAKR